MGHWIDQLKENKVTILILITILVVTISILTFRPSLVFFSCWSAIIGVFLLGCLVVYKRYESISFKEMDDSLIESVKDDLDAILVLTSIILGLFLYGVYQGIPITIMGLILLPILVLIIFGFTIRYGLIKIKYHKLKGERLRCIGSIIVVVLILVSSMSALYLEFELITTAEGEEIYHIQIEQNTSAQYEIILPNLVHEGEEQVVLSPKKYNILKGDARIEGIKDGKYIEIASSSVNLIIRFKLESYFLHQRDLVWDYQWDLIKQNETREYMNIFYDSSVDQGCNLTLEYTDNISPIIGGHWYELKVEGRLTDGNNKVDAMVDKAIV